MDKLLSAAKASDTSDNVVSETLKKRLPNNILDGKLVCIVDGIFCDVCRYTYNQEVVELNPYRVSIENAPGKDTNYKQDAILKPFTLYGHEVDNNELMLLGNDYVWVYDEVEFIDNGLAYIAWCKINLTVARKVTNKNGSKILVDIEESEFKENVRIFNSSDLAEKCVENNICVREYKLNPEKRFNANSVRHITIKDYESIRYNSKIKFLETCIYFLKNINRVSGILDKNTLIYAVPNYKFNWSEEYNYLRNCSRNWCCTPELFSLDALVLVLLMCLDERDLNKLLS